MTMLRHVGGGIQGSFYVVYLEGIGISATMIGVLLTVSGVFGLAGSLGVAPLLRFQRAHWFLLWTVIVSLVFVVITPALTGLPELMLATGLRGGALAASLVLLMTLIARVAGPQLQGQAMGLRVTLNQMVWFIVPITMGALIDLIGMAASFYLIGAVTLGLMAFAGLRVARARPFDEYDGASGSG
jgi:predicted MFS family arabinose efflux permease